MPRGVLADRRQVTTGAASTGIELRGVVKRFGTHAAVAGVDLDIQRGEFFTLLGPSGSGKTTLLRLIAGFERPDAGTISLHGQDVSSLPPHQRNVNTVFQDYALFPHFTVEQNVEYGLRIRHVQRTSRRTRVAESLEMVQLVGLAKRKPSQLSGGQRQRVALARAIINEPEVLLLDEPLGALDLKLRQEMQVELKRIQRQVGITFVYVTHDQEEALTMSDRIAVFREGRIEQVGPPVAVYEQPSSEFVASFVGTSNVIETDQGRAVLRPERLVFSDGTVQPDHVGSTARVVDVSYLGMVTRITVELPNGTMMTGIRQNRASAAAGGLTLNSVVTVSWDPREAFPLDTTSDSEVQVGLTSKGAR